MKSGRAVFLDRDGVLNQAIVIAGKPYPPASVEAIEILPGVEDGLKTLSSAGWMLIVVTNQPDVARGTSTRADVESINNFLRDRLPIDEFYVCYHDDSDLCLCRKPQPGAILGAADRFGLATSNCYMVGDRWRDIEAGIRAGCKTIFVDYSYSERKPKHWDYRVGSAKDALGLIIEDKR